MNKFLIVISLLFIAKVVAAQDRNSILVPKKPTDKEIGVILKEIERVEKNYDPAVHLVWTSAGSHYHSDLEKPERVHSIKPSLDYAVLLLDSRKSENRERAIDLLREIISQQDQNPDSKTCGIWPYHMEEPLAKKKSPADRNWADFCSVPIISIIDNHNDILPADLKEKTKKALLLAAKAIRERDVRPDYTNISCMGLYVCYKTAGMYNDAELMAYARKRLKTLYESTLLNKGFMEYNSPAYFKLSLDEILRLKQYVTNPEDYAMLDSIYKTGWGIIARQFHQPSAQWAGPHGRCYSALLGSSTYNWFYTASNGLVNPDVSISFSKDKDRYLNHQIPEQYIKYFSEPVYPRVEIDTFIRGGQKIELNPLVSYQESDKGVFITTYDVIGKSYFTKDFVLSSANRSCLWNQRRPLIAYWGTGQKPVYMQLRFLHDMYDYSSANIFCSQDSTNILGAINFTTNGGDKHVTIDVIKNATITAKDIRLRLEFGGDVSTVNFVLTDSIKRFVGGTSGNINFRFEIPFAKFGDYSGSLSSGGNERIKWIDYVFYSGSEREFNFQKIQEAVLGFLLSVKDGNNMSKTPVKADRSGEYLNLSWGNLKINALTKPYSERATLVLK
jgi:hypothetical protein